MHLPAVVRSLCFMTGFPFFFNDTATTEIYALSLHDALPIFVSPGMLVITGTVSSSTVIVWVWLLWLPQASVAVDRKATRKNSMHPPAADTSFCVMTGVPPQLSVATTAPSSAAGTPLAQLTVV